MGHTVHAGRGEDTNLLDCYHGDFNTHDIAGVAGNRGALLAKWIVVVVVDAGFFLPQRWSTNCRGIL